MADKATIKRFYELFMLYAKMDLAMLLRDTKYTLLYMFTDALASIASVSGIFLLAMRFEGIGVMSKYEMLFMLGYITVLSGIFRIFCTMNNAHISRRIGRGQLEHMFIQPLPMAVQLSTEGFIPFTGSSIIFCGILIVIAAVNQLGIVIPLWWVLSFIFNIFLSIFILICQSYLFASTAFYAPAACEEISSLVIGQLGTLKNYPLSGMPNWIKTPLLTVLPYGLMGWFPSMILLGKSPFKLAFLYPVLLAGILYAITYYLFKKGFKHYVKTGSNRYISGGHRC